MKKLQMEWISGAKGFGKNIHFVGIGGIGMSGIAEVLYNLGYRVTGSDLQRSHITDRLESLGISVFEGHDSKNVEGADVVIFSSAVKPSNPELVRARERRIPVIRRADMLAELMRMKYGIGIAGTHGKTTTAWMVGTVLAESGLDPTIIVGGRVRSLGTNARLGEGKFLVAEADEFDRSFLRLNPTIAVVTSLEAEHLDCYKDLKEIKTAFVEYVNKVPFYGAVVLCLDEVEIASIIPEVERSLVTYGVSSQADILATGIVFEGLSSEFTVWVKGKELGRISLKAPGVHNVKNALAAVAVGLQVGLEFDTIKRSLEKFSGVHRRFEVKGDVGGVTVVDEYAHHPTEVSASLEGARAGWNRRIIAVFQPHLFSRTRDFFRDFGRSFLNSDVLVVTDIYPAREEPIPGISGRLIADAARELGHPDVIYTPDKGEIAAHLYTILQPGDLVITYGAGDIYKVGEELLELLRRG